MPYRRYNYQNTFQVFRKGDRDGRICLLAALGQFSSGNRGILCLVKRKDLFSETKFQKKRLGLNEE